MARLFGTDGVRGIAGEELTCPMAFELGRAGAAVLTRGTHRPRILVGRDTRISGYMLESAILAGICSVGGDGCTVGVIPTPGIAYLTRLYGCDAGIVISASHNPYEFNGIKFFNRDGFKLPDSVEDEIEALMAQPQRLPRYSGSHVGMVRQMKTAVKDYTDFLLGKVDASLDFTGIKVVLDCANGAASPVAPELYTRLDADVMSIFDYPDGVNINARCGSTHMETLGKIVTALEADVGFAFDGDADRLLAVDHTGQRVDGDQIMMLLALELKEKGRLAHDTLVTTVMSNLGLRIAAGERGIALETTKVGDRYVLEAMQAGGYVLGGEQSGHIILLEENTTGDGLLTSLHLMQTMARHKAPLRELASVMKVLPQVMVNVPADDALKQHWRENPAIDAAVREISAGYGDKGRVLIRPSGTEPLIRIMLEGEDEAALRADAQRLAALF